MLLFVGLLPTLMYAILAWITIPILLRHRGWINIVAFFILFNTAYYCVVNALWYKSIVDLPIEAVDMLWAFQEALDVIITIFLIKLYRKTYEKETYENQMKEQTVTYSIFIAICIWVAWVVAT